jgi:hypothetical protein
MKVMAAQGMLYISDSYALKQQHYTQEAGLK